MATAQHDADPAPDPNPDPDPDATDPAHFPPARKHDTRLIVLTLLALAAGTAYLILRPPGFVPPPMPTPDAIVTFHSTPQRDLEIHLFSPHPIDAPLEYDIPPRPAALFFYGGGWLNGDARQFYAQARALANLGIVAACAQYRTQNPDGTTPQDALADALHAVAYLRENAQPLGIDPTRIAVGGGSAGGQLAAATATLPEANIQDLAPDGLPASPRPDALLLFNPVVDNGPATPEKQVGYGHGRVGDDHTWFSPAHNVRPNLPPTLFMLGTDDHLIPVAVAQNFQQAMQQHGNRCDLELYQGQTHGFFNHGRDHNTMYQATLERTIQFLTDLNWLPIATSPNH